MKGKKAFIIIAVALIMIGSLSFQINSSIKASEIESVYKTETEETTKRIPVDVEDENIHIVEIVE